MNVDNTGTKLFCLKYIKIENFIARLLSSNNYKPFHPELHPLY